MFRGKIIHSEVHGVNLINHLCQENLFSLNTVTLDNELI